MAPVLLLVLLIAVALLMAAVLLVRGRHGGLARRRATGPTWQPTVTHREIPAPPEDPVISWQPPGLETLRTPTPPLADLPLSALVRGQLDGYALGRAKRILEAPTLLEIAASDPESWPGVEATVQRALALAQAHGFTLDPAGGPVMSEALARCAVEGMLLAEWRQLEDGKTVWDGEAARIRASDAFAIARLAEVMEHRVLPDLFRGIARRSASFEIKLLVPYCIAQAFGWRLHGDPPRAFRAPAFVG